MKIRELIEELEKYDENLEVVMCNSESASYAKDVAGLDEGLYFTETEVSGELYIKDNYDDLDWERIASGDTTRVLAFISE